MSEPQRLSPADAWELLRDGNRRFVSGSPKHPHQDAQWRASLADAQHPKAVIFGCSDSRLAAEIIFDLGLGDVFVVRTAGQVIDSAVLGSLEYSVSALDVPLIVVLGHDSCGAVSAAVETADAAAMPSGYIRGLVERILPSVIATRENGDTSVNGAVEEHVRQTVDWLSTGSVTLSEAVNNGTTAIIGVTYRLAEGRADPVTATP